MLLGRFGSWLHSAAHIRRIKFTGKRLLNKQNSVLHVAPRKHDGLDLNECMRVQSLDYYAPRRDRRFRAARAFASAAMQI